MPMLVLIALTITPVYSAEPDDDSDLPLERWSPEMRELPAEDMARWPCGKLDQAKPESPAQYQALRRRRQECLQRYRQFIPGTGLR